MTENKPAGFDPKAKGFKEITWIATKNLSVVWAQSQRPLNHKHAQMIADNFDPEMFGMLAVTKPNGHGIYHLIDGNHRKVAVETAFGEEQKVPCQVFDAEDPARAAELFDHINSKRRALQPIELFHVRVTAGNDVEVSVNKIVKACGFRIGSKGGSKDALASRVIGCVGSLVSIYQSYGADVLKNTLDTIRAVWGEDSSASSAVLVRGIAEFLSEYRDFDWSRFRESLAKKYTPARLLGAAKMAREINGGSAAFAVKTQLVLTYNEGVRSEAKKLKRPEK